jgi:anti-sigma regulatory factor (Ser/Thr protein kinase)
MNRSRPNRPDPNNKDWQQYQKLPGSQMEMVVPAQLEFLNLLGTMVREYCAALPTVLESSQPHQNSLLDIRIGHRQFSTAPLQLSGAASVRVATSYSHFVYSAELVLQEAATNVIRHGYLKPQPGQQVWLRLNVARVLGPPSQPYQHAFIMELADTAPPFDPTVAAWSEPNPLNLRESGYGLYLIHKLTDQVYYSFEEGFNCLKLVKYFDFII